MSNIIIKSDDEYEYDVVNAHNKLRLKYGLPIKNDVKSRLKEYKELPV